MKKRVFLAINLPPDIKKSIVKRLLNLAKKISQKGVKFVDEDNLHITLHFLGDQSEARIQDIREASVDIAKNFSPFDVSFSGLDAFPNRQFPRVIFLKINEGQEELKRLREALGHSLEENGMEIDRRQWDGHLTLARVKFGQVDFERLRFEGENAGNWRWTVDGFSLTESTLSADGPIYNTLQRFRFYES